MQRVLIEISAKRAAHFLGAISLAASLTWLN
jgi:hypothetical protein